MYEPQVARGAALLDDKMPGWVDRIDLDVLDMESMRACVIGQLMGAMNVAGPHAHSLYYKGHDVLGVSNYDYCHPDEWWDHSFKFGFDAMSTNPDDYVPLTDAWKALIMERREAAVPAQSDHELVA